MFCGWKGNRRSGVTLAMCHRLSGISTYGLRKRDEHPPPSSLSSTGLRHLYLTTHWPHVVMRWMEGRCREHQWSRSIVAKLLQLLQLLVMLKRRRSVDQHLLRVTANSCQDKAHRMFYWLGFDILRWWLDGRLSISSSSSSPSLASLALPVSSFVVA